MNPKKLRHRSLSKGLHRPLDLFSSMSGSQSGGLMSSAGLVRYFESEDQNAIHIDPKTVIAFGGLFGILVLVLNAVGI